jgi:hypothetical protein
MNHLCGTWVGPDEYTSEVEYTVCESSSGLSVRAVDASDGEVALISDVMMVEGVLSFTTAWSSGRTCHCRIQLQSETEAKIDFSFTDHARLVRRSTAGELTRRDKRNVEPNDVASNRKIELSDGHLVAWVEQGTSVHIKALTGFGDPVELSDVEVEKLLHFLRGYLGKLS